jgi:hypothetical protein
MEADNFFGLSFEEEEELTRRKAEWLAKREPLNTLQSRRVNFLKKRHALTNFTAFTILECQELLQTYCDCEWSTSRHTSFPTTDIPVPFDSEHTKLVNERIITKLVSHFGFNEGDLELLDLFVVKYDETRPNLAKHSDGCLVSFNVLLNSPDDFVGGGTKFYDTGAIIKPNQGECLGHDSRILHEGVGITQGIRLILVGFVETKRRGGMSKQVLTGRYPATVDI